MRGALVLMMVLYTRALATETAGSFVAREFVVWNVGQGLWTSYVDADECDHFDAGGERAPWRQLIAVCRGKKNEFSLSHWDLDHISFAGRAAGRLRSACLERPPRGEGNARKEKSLAGLGSCEVGDAADSRELLPDPLRTLRLLRSARKESSNEVSRVIVVEETILVPGDSNRAAEKIWSARVPGSVTLLVLGHHGSRTSTSEELLAHLPRLKMAVASARFQKYGHPHKEVADRLRAHGVALLRTEEWGSLHFELRPACTRDSPCSNSWRQVRK